MFQSESYLENTSKISSYTEGKSPIKTSYCEAHLIYKEVFGRNTVTMTLSYWSTNKTSKD
jgi:hypothetical protein